MATIKVKYAQDGKASKGRPFELTVTEETETHVVCDGGARGTLKFSKKSGCAKGKNAAGEPRQYIMDGYPKAEAEEKAA